MAGRLYHERTMEEEYNRGTAIMIEYKSILILCEGQTEELFVNRILEQYLQTKNIFVKPVLLGGVSHYAGIKRDLERLGKNEQYDILTTMLDYYKLPQDVPGSKNMQRR